MKQSRNLKLAPRNAAAIISSYVLPATIERNPEPSYAENDGAGVEENRTNNIRMRIALATLSASISP
jgi:hypothetical protein